MDFIKSDELSNIFQNISDRPPPHKNKNKNFTSFSNLLDTNTNTDTDTDTASATDISNRKNLGLLHKSLLDTLENNSNISKTNNHNSHNNYNKMNKTNKHNNTNKDRNQSITNYNKKEQFSKSKQVFYKEPSNKKIESTVVTLNHLIESVNNKHDINLCLYTSPDNELHQILYYIISSILPEFSSYQKELRLRCFKSMRERLAYDLDEKNLYNENSYKKVFSKTNIQNILLSCKPIHDKWLLIYLSDYFDINICTIYEKLVYISTEYKNRPTILLNLTNRTLGTYVNNGISLHSASIGNMVCLMSEYVMTEFKVISKYKLNELQAISNALNIPIKNETDNGKVKNRKKDDLYSDIKNKLLYW